MATTTLTTKLQNIPNRPGVYLFQNNRGKIIYIGKAKNLRNRVRSYFQKGRATEGPKLDALTSKIADLEWIVTDSEVEALILEANLVKENHPRYNVNLKDDKSFPYIRVTREEFPRIFPTRKIIRDGSRYFGPYTDVHAMRDLFKTVRKIFPIRSCNYRLDDLTVAEQKVKLCLDYHIQRCLGPCEGLIGKEEYAQIVAQIVAFIEGKDAQVLAELDTAMRAAASQQQFEKAARIRDQIKAIEIFSAKQKVVSADELDRDIIGIACEDEDACGLIFKVRNGKITGRYHFYLTRYLNQTEPEILHSFLQQYYIKVDFIPAEVFLQYELENAADFEEWLSQKAGSRVKVLMPKIGEKAKLVRLAVNNAKLLLNELQLQRQKENANKVAGAVLALQQALSLAQPPKLIEAFDISNISGTDAVAAMVTFRNGQANKSNYRRFKIKTVAGSDDFAMMKEVVKRRYRRLLAEKKNLPDLILVDGGKGQLSSALTALNELGLNQQPVIALAKRLDEVFVPGISDPQNIPKHSSALKLLQQIRDESHRFAVTYHRTLRSKRQVLSELEQIVGLGAQRRKLLLEYFGSVRQIRTASLADLKAVKRLPPAIAEAVYQHFHGKEQNSVTTESSPLVE